MSIYREHPGLILYCKGFGGNIAPDPFYFQPGFCASSTFYGIELQYFVLGNVTILNVLRKPIARTGS